MEDSPVPVSCNFSLHLFASITDTLNPGGTLLVWLDDGCFVVLLRRTGSCDLLLCFIIGWPCPLLFLYSLFVSHILCTGQVHAQSQEPRTERQESQAQYTRQEPGRAMFAPLQR